MSISIFFFWKYQRTTKRTSGSDHILITKKFSCKNYAKNKPPKCNISLNIFYMNPLNPLEANHWTITISFSRIPNNLNFNDIPPIFIQSQLLQIPNAKILLSIWFYSYNLNLKWQSKSWFLYFNSPIASLIRTTISKFELDFSIFKPTTLVLAKKFKFKSLQA